MATVVVLHNSDFQAVAKALQIGDVIEHKNQDHGSIYNILLAHLDSLNLIPISAGTQLYIKHGYRSSYVEDVKKKDGSTSESSSSSATPTDPQISQSESSSDSQSNSTLN